MHDFFQPFEDQDQDIVVRVRPSHRRQQLRMRGPASKESEAACESIRAARLESYANLATAHMPIGDRVKV